MFFFWKSACAGKKKKKQWFKERFPLWASDTMTCWGLTFAGVGIMALHSQMGSALFCKLSPSKTQIILNYHWKKWKWKKIHWDSCSFKVLFIYLFFDKAVHISKQQFDKITHGCLFYRISDVCAHRSGEPRSVKQVEKSFAFNLSLWFCGFFTHNEVQSLWEKLSSWLACGAHGGLSVERRTQTKQKATNLQVSCVIRSQVGSGEYRCDQTQGAFRRHRSGYVLGHLRPHSHNHLNTDERWVTVKD